MHHSTTELLNLIQKSFENNLTEPEAARLMELCSATPEAMQTYVDFCSLHAELTLTGGQSYEAQPPFPNRHRSSQSVVQNIGDSEYVSSTSRHWQSIHNSLATTAVVAAAITCMIGYWFLAGSDRQSYVAQLVEAKECRWDAGTLPTEVNAKLNPGRLRLAEGLAAILFNSGVQLRIEGPADIEVVTPMKCIVRRGRVLAKVPPSGKGFVMVTPSSILTDYGTEFGVAVAADSDAAVVSVFKGRVDAFHPQLGRTEKMESGATFSFTESSMAKISSPEEALMLSRDSNHRSEKATSIDALTPHQVQITTAQGAGKDAFIQPIDVPADRASETLLLVKRPVPQMEEWERRAYLGFDLSEVIDQEIEAAELSLTFAATGYGFAYLVPDTQFNVYGIADDVSWDEQTISWDNAPGMWDINDAPPPQVKLLGSFEIKQGVQAANCKIATDELRDFLNTNESTIVTLIVVRQTVGLGTSDLVHGIVSRRHPTLSPPTLRLSVK